MRLFGITVLTFCLCGPLTRANDQPVFSRDIQPLLQKHCVACHGPDKAESGLRIDDSRSAFARLESGTHAIVPGDPSKSELMRRVTSSDEDRMPPEGDPLSPDEIKVLKHWIRDGAEFEAHWAWQPVPEVTPPAVEDTAWIRNPIDRFVFARLQAAGIEPSPTAKRATLIKRLSYDLTGLPPTQGEVDAFLADESDKAWESLVDGLLSSPHFGERWGRHWLDRARYADSDGYEKDRPRPNAWRYRDWVIEAINNDLPFNQFTIEQLAGDLLAQSTPSQKLATAFHRQTLTNTEGGTDQEEFRVEATFDRTETTSAVWMALTMTCARCHNHKYDQIRQDEYYQLFSFFNNANETKIDVPRSNAETEQYERDSAVHDKKRATADLEYAEALKNLQPEIDRWTAEISQNIDKPATDPTYHPLKFVNGAADNDVVITGHDDGTVVASGANPDKTNYTLEFELPMVPLTGLRLEALSDDSLPGHGPGRAKNGNFVLSRLTASLVDVADSNKEKPQRLTTAESDFAQDKFPATNALIDQDKSGWAVSPQTGQDHPITFFFATPLAGPGQKLKVVLDFSYGGQHTLGRFRMSGVSGTSPGRSLPEPVATSIRKSAAERSNADTREIADYVASLHAPTAVLQARIAELKRTIPVLPVMTVRILEPAKRTTNVLNRGDFLQPSDEVAPNALEIISEHHPLLSRHTDQPADRLDLAHWLMSSNHPLTARVTVNQIWAHLFGRGIVPTQNDFGVRGDLPTHPELLDWLAGQFSGELQWSRKKLIRLIVNSATWRQSSNHRPDLKEIDPTNELLARQNRIRVEAEIVRDLHLAAAGLLSKKIGGPSVFPPLPPGVAELSYANNFKWKTSKGDDAWRRGMYTFFKRTSPHPTLISFDCPDSNTTQLEREVSNTPLQALVTLNNEVYAQAAQALAKRTLQEGGESEAHRIRWALRQCLIRIPQDDEVRRFADLLNIARQYYESSPEAAEKAVGEHAAADVDAAENASWVATTRMIMNLDEFIVRD